MLFVATDVWISRDDAGYVSTHSSMTLPSLEKYFRTGMPVTLVARSLHNAHVSHGHLFDDRLEIWDVGIDDKSQSLWKRCALLLGGLLSLPVDRSDVVVVRLPELVGTVFGLLARLRGATLICNVVAETQAVSNRFGFLEPVVRCVLTALVRWLIRYAAGAIYVTERWLQQSLPPRDGRPTLASSNVSLDDRDFSPGPRDFCVRPLGESIAITAVGHHNSSGKGHDLLIQACGSLVRLGWSIELHLVGDGPEQARLRQIALKEQLTDVVTFHGYLPARADLHSLLDATDFFVMPSRSEGLPRALIEAMARGICCMGSRVGGIPELLSDDVLFEVGGAEQIVDRLEALVGMPPTELSRLVANQWDKAKEVAARAGPELIAAFITVASGVRTDVD